MLDTFEVEHGTILTDNPNLVSLLRMLNVSYENGEKYFGAITEDTVLYATLTENGKKWLAFGDWFERIGSGFVLV